jgi:signal transduction histidine kinase
VIQVEDTGPRIAAPDLPRILERFYRAEPSAGQRPGTGIGLAVAKECVELHGGTIQAENRAEGGARFTMRLPLTPAPATS